VALLNYAVVESTLGKKVWADFFRARSRARPMVIRIGVSQEGAGCLLERDLSRDTIVGL
jgi:hypothetical protein